MQVLLATAYKVQFTILAKTTTMMTIMTMTIMIMATRATITTETLSLDHRI